MGGELCKKMGFTLPPPQHHHNHTHTPLFLLGTGEKGTQNLLKKISDLTSDLLPVNEDEAS